MIRKTSIALAVAAGLSAAIAMAPGPHSPESQSEVGTGRGDFAPAYIKGNVLDRCFADPVECGLVVW